MYNEYGRFDERISYLEEFISRSLYVPELMNCLERDWLLCIKHFPWQADESMVELKQLQQKVQTILDERKSKSSSTPMGMNG